MPVPTISAGRTALATYPDQHEASYSLGLLLVGTGRSGEALEYLARASAGMPRRSRVHYNYGLLLAQMGEDGPAEAALSKALNLEPDSMDYLFALIEFYYWRGRLEAALRLAEGMIAAHPESPLGHELKVRIEAGL